MKNLREYGIFFLLFLLACSSDNDRKTSNISIVKPSIEIKIENGNSNLALGDTLSLTIAQINDVLSFTEIEITLNDSLLGKYKTLPIRVKIGTSNLKLGKSKIKVRAATKDKVESKTASFTILSDTPPLSYTYKVVNVYPHDGNSYTQGLIYYNNFLYEGSGQTGHSKLTKVNIEDGKVQKEHKLDENIFGEGIALFDEKIFQLSWTSQAGFVYDVKSFEEIGRFYYQGEGWGLTADDQYLYRSDGSNKIYIHNPNDFSLISSIEVYSDKKQITYLNELEFIDGKIYANVWQKDEIAIINPLSGKLEGIINLKGLLSKKLESNSTNVLNGIAFDRENNRLFVTGKNWPKLFEIRIVQET